MKKHIVIFCLSLFALAGGAEEPKFYPVDSAAPGEWFMRSIESGRAKHEKFYRDRLDKLAPREKRAAHAAAYLDMLDRFAISNRAENAGIEKALNWLPGDFTYHNDAFYRKYRSVLLNDVRGYIYARNRVLYLQDMTDRAALG